MASTSQELRQLFGVASSSALKEFHLFPFLKFELRARIWQATLPSRAIEVYNKPNCYDSDSHVSSFAWHAIKCKCARRCYQEPAVARVNHEARNIVNKCRSKCFGQWIYWERDIIYIGERVGTLHNTGFLHALERAGSREELRYLAIDYDCWVMSQNYECPKGNKEECTPAAMTSRLPGLRRLIVVQQTGAWRDGNEVQVCEPYINGAYRFDSSPCYGEWGYGNWIYETNNNSSARLKTGPNDPWTCGGLGRLIHRGSGSYLYRGPNIYREFGPYIIFESDNQVYGENGDCGIAFVPSKKIQPDHPKWAHQKISVTSFIQAFAVEEERLRLGPENGYPGEPDYEKWKIPIIEFTELRKTAPSCMMEDWNGLEKDWMSYSEACWARDFGESYRDRDRSKDYPPGQHYETFEAIYRANHLIVPIMYEQNQ